MARSPFWNWFYKFLNFEGAGSPSRPKNKQEVDSFDELHRDFLWLKGGQIDQWVSSDGNDPVLGRNARTFFLQDFVDALCQESIGGNAGAGHTAVHAFYNPLTGEIKYFGNFQDVKGALWHETTGSTTVEGDFNCLFRINVQYTGKIAEVIFEQKPLSDLAQKRLAGLVGFQVMIPFTRVYQALRSTAVFDNEI
jgi:hypothetical protein